MAAESEPPDPVRDHVFNDDLLLRENERKHAAESFKIIFHVLDDANGRRGHFPVFLSEFGKDLFGLAFDYFSFQVWHVANHS
jgi:hypothetical protein